MCFFSQSTVFRHFYSAINFISIRNMGYVGCGRKKHTETSSTFYYLVHDTLIFSLLNSWKKGCANKQRTFHQFPERQK